MDRIDCWHGINLSVIRLFRVVFFIVFVEDTRESVSRRVDRASITTFSGCHFLPENGGIFFHHDSQTEDTTLLQVTRDSGVCDTVTGCERLKVLH